MVSTLKVRSNNTRIAVAVAAPSIVGIVVTADKGMKKEVYSRW